MPSDADDPRQSPEIDRSEQERLRQENARLKEILRRHGIDPGLPDMKGAKTRASDAPPPSPQVTHQSSEAAKVRPFSTCKTMRGGFVAPPNLQAWFCQRREVRQLAFGTGEDRDGVCGCGRLTYCLFRVRWGWWTWRFQFGMAERQCRRIGHKILKKGRNAKDAEHDRTRS